MGEAVASEGVRIVLPRRWAVERSFETLYVAGQMRLFGLAETLGEDGWLKALKLEDYAPRRSRRPEMLQQVLCAYTDAV